MGLAYYSEWMKRRRARTMLGPGAAAIDEYKLRRAA